MIGNDWDQKLEIIWNSPGFQKFYKMIMAEYDKKSFILRKIIFLMH